MILRLAVAIASLTGFVALSYEVAWFRVVSYVTWGRPAAFGTLLAAYLMGLAVGSRESRRFCKDDARGDRRSLRALGKFIIAANVASFLVAPAMARGAGLGLGGIVFAFLLVVIAAAMMGAVFPLLAHFAIAPDDRAGQQLSYLYFANIIGSALGSLITGFLFLDSLTLAHTCLVLAVLGALVGSSLLIAGSLGVERVRAVATSAVVLVATLLVAPRAYDQLYERLQFRDKWDGAAFAEVIENKSGVITVTADGTVYGGGAYDGRLNTSLLHDRNGIVRAIAIGAMHPAPKEVLMIGLASGSWAQILANNEEIKHLTIIEINPGYLELISHHPEVASLLSDPHVTIEIDDGRRWLLRHPERKFDAIVMNTTWHWRAHITNLLSVEFMNIARAHLLAGGLFYFNTTSSREVQKTAMTTFPYGMRYINFVAVSDAPFSFDKAKFRHILQSFRIMGQPAIDTTEPEGSRLIDLLVAMTDKPGDDGLESRESILQRTSDATIVTDDNMAVEYKDPLKMFETP